MTDNKKYHFIKIKNSVPPERTVKILISFCKKKGIKNPTFTASMVGNDFVKDVLTYKIWESEPIPDVFKNHTND